MELLAEKNRSTEETKERRKRDMILSKTVSIALFDAVGMTTNLVCARHSTFHQCGKKGGDERRETRGNIFLANLANLANLLPSQSLNRCDHSRFQYNT